MLRTFRDLRGFTIRATDGDIGKVDDLFFDDQIWVVRYFVVSTGRWLSDRNVLISPRAASMPEADARVLPVQLTRDMVKQSPEIDVDAHQDQPISRGLETELSRHFGWPRYWNGGGLDLPGMNALAVAEEARVEAEERSESRLRSADEVIGHHIQATDGDIGHVEDFLLDGEAWAIRYLVAGTRNWLPGRKVLLSPEWIEKVSWGEASVYVDLTRDQVKQSPAYDPAAELNRHYEAQLHDHYGRIRYWI